MRSYNLLLKTEIIYDSTYNNILDLIKSHF